MDEINKLKDVTERFEELNTSKWYTEVHIINKYEKSGLTISNQKDLLEHEGEGSTIGID